MKLLCSGMMTVIALLVGCGSGPQPISDLDIANGKVIVEGDFPSVVQLFRKVYVNGKRRGASLCTGAWIADDLILTAAHCTGEGSSDEQGLVENLEMYVVEITDHDASPKSSKLITTVVDAWRIKAWEKRKKSNRFDLAVLQTQPRKSNERPRVISEISKFPANKDDTVTLVGYGYHNITRWSAKGDDRKRVGYNTIDAYRNGFIDISGQAKDKSGGADGQDANAGMGDSGGPMFHDGAIIGVASSGGTSGLAGRGSSSYVDLHSEESLQFLKRFK